MARVARLGLLLALVAAWPAPVAAAPAAGDGAATSPPHTKSLQVDHLMIHVSAGAPERAALERAGFRIAPEVQAHEGQGSASVMVELQNGFLELAWRDTNVSVAPGLGLVATRFRRMGEWRTSGWSPFGIGLRRAPGAPDSLPFPTRAVRAQWMEPGIAIEIISASGDTLGPRLWVVPRSMAASGRPNSESERRRLSNRAAFLHPNGARTITAVKLMLPGGVSAPATQIVAQHSPVEFARGEGWLLEVTFDGGRKGTSRDLRPVLPLLCRF